MIPTATLLDATRTGPDLLQRLDDCLASMLAAGGQPDSVSMNRETHDLVRDALELPPGGTLGTLRMLKVKIEDQVPTNVLWVTLPG